MGSVLNYLLLHYKNKIIGWINHKLVFVLVKRFLVTLFLKIKHHRFYVAAILSFETLRSWIVFV